MEVQKIYEYRYGDKTIVVKRTWSNSGSTARKRKALDDYISQNMDAIAGMKNYKAVFNDYLSKNQENTVSYTTMLKKLHSVFGKKNVRHNSPESSEKEEEEQIV